MDYMVNVKEFNGSPECGILFVFFQKSCSIVAAASPAATMIAATMIDATLMIVEI